jgi:hypothetical protein
LCTVSPGFAEQIMSILLILCYNGSLVTWTVVSLAVPKFKPLIFSMAGLTLSYAANTPIAAGCRQHSHPWFRVPWDSWPYFTVWRLWEPWDHSLVNCGLLTNFPRWPSLYSLCTDRIGNITSNCSLFLRVYTYLLPWTRVYRAVAWQWLHFLFHYSIVQPSCHNILQRPNKRGLFYICATISYCECRFRIFWPWVSYKSLPHKNAGIWKQNMTCIE